MAESISNIASPVSMAAQQRAAMAPAPKEPEASGAAPALSTQPVSPSFRFDPTAGVMITEYFNSNGEVQTQLPSAASIAYMRAGLSPTGMPREHAEPAAQAVEPEAKAVVA